MTTLFQKLFGNQDNNHKEQKCNAPQARRLRMEPLECRELLAVDPASLENLFHLDNDLPAAFVSPLDQVAVVTNTAADFVVADPPVGYNAHDWGKVEAAKAVNGLWDGQAEWTQIGDEWRLTAISASGSRSLNGSLDLSGCTALQTLDCVGNQLTSLDVSNNTALQNLYCSSNQLTSLDVSGCTALDYLRCYSNQLTSLDVSNNTELGALDCDSNQLASLDVSGCTALHELYCYSNQLTSLDVSGCTALLDLRCYSNQLASLDVSNNKALGQLHCFSNKLTSLDVSGCTALRDLRCSSNQLASLDVSNNTALQYLYCYSNQLASLDVSGCTALWYLDCYSNQLTSLDVSGCTALRDLDCYSNQLTSLDVSNNTKLGALDCDSNQLISLDVSGCTVLYFLDCRYNQLTFSTLPLRGTISGYSYGSQKSVVMAYSLDSTQSLDLSSEYMIDGTSTVYLWHYANGTTVPTNLYANENGEFTFHDLSNGDVIYCEMTNTKFPNLTLKTTNLTITTSGGTPDEDWLRDTIADAKPGDIITLSPGTITLATGELIIDKSVTIIGNGVTIDADGKSRVLSVASGTTVELVGMTFTNGFSNEPGGGINNSGNLTLTDCTIEGNVSKSYGGGIYNRRGTLEINNCTITGNATNFTDLAPGVVSGGTGGGIYNIGTMYINDSEITKNTSTLFAGGGIYNEGTMEVTNCVIKENKAHWGGGVTNTNFGTLTMAGCTITENIANQGYGGIGNAGNLTITDTVIIRNDATKLGGGLGNNSGTVTIQANVTIAGNHSNDGNHNAYTYNNGEINGTYSQTAPAPLPSPAMDMLVYEISGPEELFDKTLTSWEFSATSSIAIKDWEINWGDGSDTTQILGGPRSRVSETHYFHEAGTYAITIITTDFNGNVNSTIIGTYTVKAKMVEPLAVEEVVLIEPVADMPELLQVEPSSTVSFATWTLPTNESRFTITDSYLAELAATMRQRQMLDLDQSGLKSDRVAVTDIIWSDGELFDDEWFDFSEPEDAVEADPFFEFETLAANKF